MELQVDQLTAGYPGHLAVSGVDLTIPSGRVVAIVGPNGCGKSTLLRTIARLHQPQSGTVRAGGADIWQLKQRRAAHRIALLPQSPQAPEAVTVAGLVRYGRHPHQGLFRQWSREDEAAVREALAVTGTTELAERRLDQLSGGQRQRCWLAMVLAQQTPIVLLDEPTSALDLGHAVEVLELVREVAAAGRTVVMVLHDLAGAARYADVVVAMHGGRVVAQGPAREVVDAALVKRLYGIEADILAAPGDGSPVVVPAARVPSPTSPPAPVPAPAAATASAPAA
ncbi:ABC transporter ATP-binding protein [Streptomyces sp. MST-110588]|uniref:ABC transporter ATP-binding protein n=1 Tax=Streptomyces sp. MST-110588 TaxID=2833628 RepID=UPI001F5C7E54|nr:ABC transporter ATP-binding protein [Streptomyces sp. MST-110588]UNO39249.1 ABC transporter ATP-binding protein [Streptomyces sp. MST-110588]